MEADRIVGQTLGPVAAGDGAAQHRAHHPVDVANGQRGPDGPAFGQGRAAEVQQCLAVQRPIQPMILLNLAGARLVRGRLVEQGAEVQAAPSGVRSGRIRSRSERPIISSTVRKPNSAINSRTSWAIKRMKLTTCCGSPWKLAQRRVLRGHAHGAGVQVADAHHDAAQRHQRRRGKTELFGPQQGGNENIAPRFELAVRFQAHAGAQAVEHEGLVGFGQPQLPGQPACLMLVWGDAPRAAVVAADEDDVGLAFGHPGGHRAHAHFGDQLDVDAGLGIGVFQVVDQLGQILNGVDVVVGRRRDEAHAGGGMAHFGNPGIDFVAGQLAAFARLGPLGHLDLNFDRFVEVLAGDAETAAGHLLDGAVARVAVGVGRVAGRVFAPFAGVAFAADAVHGNGQRSRGPPG
jgi:hypothetical protein